MANKRTLGEHLGGRMIGICFFLALEFAVVSSLFTFFEIAIRAFENKFKLARKKAALIFAVIIGTGNIIVSLGFGVLSGIQLPWLDFHGITHCGLYDWLDCFTGYILLPLGCWMICLFNKILTIGTTFFTALTLKASIGTYACWDVLSVNVSELSGLKIATFCMIMNTLFVLLQILLLRKNFQPYKLLQIPYVIFFSSMVNFFYYRILTFQVNTYPVHLLLFILSVIGVSFFLAFLTSLNIVSIPVETTFCIISSRYSVDYAALRVGIDVACILISIGLSLAFHLDFAVREGTFLVMFLLGPSENLFPSYLAPLSGKLRCKLID